MLTCPVCNIEFPDNEIQAHLYSNHPFFIAFLEAFFVPPSFDFFEEEVQLEDTYEELIDLCERLGNVEIGVKDIDDVTDVIVTDKTNNTDTCPICLECMTEVSDYIRRIHVCAHKFCGACIETWLKSHKTCPICKVELEQDPPPNHIPSITSSIVPSL